MSLAEANAKRWLVRVEGTALAAAAASAVVVTVVGAIAAGATAALGASLGAGCVTIFFGLGALFDVWAVRRDLATGMFAVVASFLVRVIAVMAAGFALVGTFDLSRVWLGAGVTVATLTWVAGMIVGHVTGRWPVYDLPDVGVAA